MYNIVMNFSEFVVQMLIVEYCLNVIISDHEHFECYSGVVVTKM